jgi:hypothetical protein
VELLICSQEPERQLRSRYTGSDSSPISVRLIFVYPIKSGRSDLNILAGFIDKVQ